MEPIQSINMGLANQTPSARPIMASVQAGTAAAGASTLPAVNGGTNTTSITQVHQSVSQLLSTIGGGAEQDQLLRTLIMLMIILSLLTGSQGKEETGARSLRQLGSQGGNPSLYVGIFSSSTTITIQQTTTIISPDVMGAFGSSGGADQASGGRVDTTV